MTTPSWLRPARESLEPSLSFETHFHCFRLLADEMKKVCAPPINLTLMSKPHNAKAKTHATRGRAAGSVTLRAPQAVSRKRGCVLQPHRCHHLRVSSHKSSHELRLQTTCSSLHAALNRSLRKPMSLCGPHSATRERRVGSATRSINQTRRRRPMLHAFACI